jgi:hypothetical protein
MDMQISERAGQIAMYDQLLICKLREKSGRLFLAPWRGLKRFERLGGVNSNHTFPHASPHFTRRSRFEFRRRLEFELESDRTHRRPAGLL